MLQVHVLARVAGAEVEIHAALAALEAVERVSQRLVLSDSGALFDVVVDAESAGNAVDLVERALKEVEDIRVRSGAAPTYQPAIRAAFRQAGFAAQTPRLPRRATREREGEAD